MAKFESDQSFFNVAFPYLLGLLESLKMCKRMAVAGSIEGWVSWLRIVYREISAKTTDAEDKNINTDFKKINYFINDPSLSKKNKTYILFLLDQLEIKLRKIAQAKSMLLANKSDPRFAVLER